MTVVGVFGSRYGAPATVIQSVIDILSKKHGDLFVVVGDCVGVDQQVYNYCVEIGIPIGVFVVYDNWNKISYKPSPEHVLEVVGDGSEPLKVRLHERTVRLVEYVKRHGGYLVGINTNGKGSQLAIRTAKQLGVPVKLVNPKR